MVLYIPIPGTIDTAASTPTEYPRLTRSQHAISEVIDTGIHALDHEFLVASPKLELSPEPPLSSFSVSTNDGINMRAGNR